MKVGAGLTKLSGMGTDAIGQREGIPLGAMLIFHLNAASAMAQTFTTVHINTNFLRKAIAASPSC
jgi:hypothetical protein